MDLRRMVVETKLATIRTRLVVHLIEMRRDVIVAQPLVLMGVEEQDVVVNLVPLLLHHLLLVDLVLVAEVQVIIRMIVKAILRLMGHHHRGVGLFMRSLKIKIIIRGALILKSVQPMEDQQNKLEVITKLWGLEALILIVTPINLQVVLHHKFLIKKSPSEKRRGFFYD